MRTFSDQIKRKEAEFSARLKEMRPEAMERFGHIQPDASLHSFHAYIGSNNNRFVDSVRMQFQSPEDFIARWLNGLKDEVIEDLPRIRRRRQFGDRKQTTEVLPELLQDEFLKEYVYLFLERNFYRNFNERVRAKPDEPLWQLWFGGGNLVWGLLIAPDLRFGEWTNDKSQMRREPHAYWTIAHVINSGLIAPESENPVEFDSVEGFLTFYETVLARVSNSEYEKYISNAYIEYVRSSKNPESIPLLIPELRFAGKEKHHKYRLDFCILNSYSMKMVGFEISPASSHMSIKGITSKTQVKLNEELSHKWDKESEKRNAYFKEYGITTVTFTDAHLNNVEDCFSTIVDVLEERATDVVSIISSEQSLDEVYKNI